ncbi:hypothetical protein JYU34_000524 [Plutella xylostella]|uniref:ATPase AAA-type core domain-containing protein n=1 Tax=Plutella xylostella TaxID=51655 RepID=A0ABQ7R7Y2_PLUXY|nr:hypothetical protein JYU34_000524 [Plutella xylostella]
MANKEYYKLWLDFKDDFKKVLADDVRIQELADRKIGIKPQSTAVEILSRVYCKYCELYNKLCEYYDQMEQVQRRPYIKTLIDSITCRIIELKRSLEEIESFEFTYTDNALQQLILVPQNVEILCPFFYPFEIREKEIQYIIDEIMAGNRLGDPTPTQSEILRQEEAKEEEERIKQEEKEEEIKRKLAFGEEIEESKPVIVYSPEQLAKIQAEEEYTLHLSNIQRMERSRVATKERVQKANKDENMYLFLAGLKVPLPSDEIKNRASSIIQRVYRKFMELKREELRNTRLKENIGMVMPSYTPPSAKIELERVKEIRRNFRRAYYEKWLEENVTENSKVLRLRKHDIMEDITAEVRAWFLEWYTAVNCFDEYPWPGEGGSILVVRGETMTTAEYEEWKKAEEKRMKQAANNPKTKEQIKAEKKEAREEKKNKAREEKQREKIRQANYMKQRLNPKSDPGVYLPKSVCFDPIKENWKLYENQWNQIDTRDPEVEAIKGYIMKLITEDAYQNAQFQLRPIVDEMMRLELKMLKKALKKDLKRQEKEMPLIRKRKKPKKVRPPKPEKVPPAVLFQKLVDAGVVKPYPRVTLDDYWGDRNYAAADLRTVPWVPKFPPPCLGDVREQVRLRCLLTLGCDCPNAERSHLIVGPRRSGKKTLVYAIATETNSVVIDLSPINLHNKFPGKELKGMYQLVNKISKIMQPTIILLDNADKVFYKKVPKEDRSLNPTRIQRDFYKKIAKNVKNEDKILIMGTASQPWLSKKKLLRKSFKSVILLPRTDYGSISLILHKELMKYHGVNREFDVHSLAQTIRGYDVQSILAAVKVVLCADRIATLGHTPLQPLEILNALLEMEDAVYTDDEGYKLYTNWYMKYSEWGEKYANLMTMIDAQYQLKLKQDKKKKKKPPA